MIPAFKHQTHTTEFLLNHPRAFVLSDPGTGKTRSCLEFIQQALGTQRIGRTLVVAPKSTMQSAWGDDCDKFTPNLKYTIASAEKRLEAFEAKPDIVVTTPAALAWLRSRQHLLAGFDSLVLDESPYFKHQTSERSSSMRALKGLFKNRILMSGTFVTNSAMDAWHQALICDDGKRLGKSFYAFRAAICEPKKPNPFQPFVTWVERPGAIQAIVGLLQDISIRYSRAECLDLPKNQTYTIHFDLEKKHFFDYCQFVRQKKFETDSGETLTAINAAVLTQKLLQFTSGAVYDSEKTAVHINTARNELILDLVEQRQHSVVAYTWKHQLEGLSKEAAKRNIPFTFIDGSISTTERTDRIRQFQEGQYQTIFLQTQAAAHGITLTRATATIWASPTFNAEHFIQTNARILRPGQENETETILISANNTLEEEIYQQNLAGKLDMITTLQTLMQAAR